MTELALRPDLAPAPYSFEQDWQLASRIARTEFVPPALRGKPEAVLACILTGREIGIGPMQSLRQVYVNNGRIGFMAQLMVDLVRSRGHRIRTLERTPERATVEGVRKDDPEHAERVTFTIEDAKRAKLIGKDTYQQYPQDMCWSRAVSALCRTLFSDVLHGGAYTPEELNPDGVTSFTVATGPAEVDGEPFDGGIPKTWALDNIRDPEDARWLLQQPEVDEEYREAVKNVIASLSLNWSSFWRSASADQWRAVLTKARPLEPTSETAEPAPQSPPRPTGSATTSEAGEREGAPDRHDPPSDPKSPEPNPQPTAAAGSGEPTPPSESSPSGGGMAGRRRRGGRATPGSDAADPPPAEPSDEAEQAQFDEQLAGDDTGRFAR